MQRRSLQLTPEVPIVTKIDFLLKTELYLWSIKKAIS